MKVNSPLEVYKYLPATNCGECGETTCMAFAAELINRKYSVDDCTPIHEDKFKKKYEELVALVAPEIREVIIGTGEKAVAIGGDDVLFRHKLTFFNQTALAYDVTDTMDKDEMVERAKNIQGFGKFYIGEFLNVDMVALRCVSDDPKTFADAAKALAGAIDIPIILCSFNPAVLEAGLKAIGDKRPLIYAATKDNWQEVSKLVLEYNVPVTLFSPDDLDTLKSMAVTLDEMGIEDIVLDPGTFPSGKQLKKTFENFLKLRRAGITEGQKDIAYPIMAVPMTAWFVHEDKISASYWETVLASTFTIRYGDIMILHSTEPYAMLPEVHIRDTIYTDPRTPVQVDPGVNEVGSPTKDSPLIITANFALTYYTVESDLSSNGIDCYLAAVGTDGIGIEAAVAGGQLTAAAIKKTLDDAGFDMAEKTNHNTVIIPGLSARLQGDVEDELKVKVLVGPQDSGQIPKWMVKAWNKSE